jgi:hypothetical protein
MPTAMTECVGRAWESRQPVDVFAGYNAVKLDQCAMFRGHVIAQRRQVMDQCVLTVTVFHQSRE